MAIALKIDLLAVKKPVFRVNRFHLVYGLCMATLAVIGALYADYQNDSGFMKGNAFHYASDITYVDIPRVSLTLPGNDLHQGHLRMDISIEVEKKYADRIEGYLPRISEHIASFTSRLDFDELSQPASAHKLRQYLLDQANEASSPLPIVDIIFRQYVII